MTKAISFLKLMLATGLIFGLFFGIGAGVTTVFNQADKNDLEPIEEEETLVKQDGNRTNILVLGVDARPGETKSRSDTMMLVSVDPKLEKAVIISIPRDTKVNMKGAGFDKICAANVVGGPEYAVKAVENLMKVKVDHFVEMDFNGFKEVVDTLGGVNINVPERMYKPSEDINLKPGQQKLNGRDALAFVRYRDYINGDIDRTAAQQVFMHALGGEVLQAKTITKLPKLVKQINKHVNTNMGITDMLKMASWAPSFTKDSIITQTLPGTFYDQRDQNGVLTASYWLADKSSMDGLIENLMAGKTIAVIQGVQSVQVPAKRKNTDEEIRVGDLDEKDKEDKKNKEDKENKEDKKDREDQKDEEDKKKPDPEKPEPSTPDYGGEYEQPTIPPTSGPEGYI
ncbi:MAG TPA: LCP family protein [Syntrophomonadaceae bacterium]|nr:LCP family protein [Syntrophomonadaceae bacterium]